QTCNGCHQSDVPAGKQNIDTFYQISPTHPVDSGDGTDRLSSFILQSELPRRANLLSNQIVCCTPESNSAFCGRVGKNCGPVTAKDNGGTSGTVNSCGTCASPQTCGGAGTANVCGSSSGTTCAPTVTSISLAKCDSTAVFDGKLFKCISQAAGVNGE